MRSVLQRLTVTSDAAAVNAVLVQRPFGLHRFDTSPPREAARYSKPADAELAIRQHASFVRELEKADVKVLNFEDVLSDALQWPDGRDWILERRLRPIDDETGCAAMLHDWLQDMPPERLSRILIEGADAQTCPQAAATGQGRLAEGHPCCLPPLPGLVHLRGGIRWICNGVVIGQGRGHEYRAAAVNVSAALHFSRVFDESQFEFLLASDGAEPGWPPIDGRDIAFLTESVVIGAVTATTSAAALRLLALSLFRRHKLEEMLCVDLLGSGADHLDDCLVVLDEDCILVDRPPFERAGVFVIRDAKVGMMHEVETSKVSFLPRLAALMAPAVLRVIDISRLAAGRVKTALATLSPVVLAPGRVMAFDEHEPAFAMLEENGIQVAAALPGSALSEDGRGPRSLAAIISSKPIGQSA